MVESIYLPIMIVQELRVKDTPLLFGMALIHNNWPKTSSINIQFGMR